MSQTYPTVEDRGEQETGREKPEKQSQHRRRGGFRQLSRAEGHTENPQTFNGQGGVAETPSAGRVPSGSCPGGRVVKVLGLWPLQVGCFPFICPGKEKKTRHET